MKVWRRRFGTQSHPNSISQEKTCQSLAKLSGVQWFQFKFIMIQRKHFKYPLSLAFTTQINGR